ncbi:hypothetical protein OG589_40660 [Sphaerisporangium sp. NBC_01403]|uniref:hypothetical protein n=1 Tax=Sphaerisporangium sp. NBC_01403 TaxID=2903599 RepID=UPI00324AD006
MTRSITFVRAGDHLVSRSAKIRGFVKMQGARAHAERLLLLRGREIGLRFDDSWPVDADLLNDALDTTRVEAWSGVTAGRKEPFDTLQLWLATALEGFCLIAVDRTLDTGLVAPVNPIATPSVVDEDSFAYLALRQVDEATVEFGAHAFGPNAAVLAEALADQIRIWDRDHRGGPWPTYLRLPGGYQ